MSNNFHKLYVLLILVLMTFVASCQSVSTYYQGRTVAPEDVIPIPGDAKNAEWLTFDMTVTYSYKENGKMFDIEGQAKLSEHYPMNYSHLDRLAIYLVFLDNNSTVLETASLADTPSLRLEMPIPFSLRHPIPADAAAFSFAYDGVARESGKVRRGGVPFWHLPKKNTQ